MTQGVRRPPAPGATRRNWSACSIKVREQHLVILYLLRLGPAIVRPLPYLGTPNGGNGLNNAAIGFDLGVDIVQTIGTIN